MKEGPHLPNPARRGERRRLVGLIAAVSIVLACVVAFAAGAARQQEPPAADAGVIRIGSKQFTENIVLGDALTLLARAEGYEAAHRRALGGSAIVLRALETGEIDAYIEYTGTILGEHLAALELESMADAEPVLAERGIRFTQSLGFNNTYALGMSRERAESLGIERVSDLREHPDLRLGFNDEFMQRSDGWPAVRARYGLPHTDVRGMEHVLALRAVAGGQIDVTDLYSTDAEIEQFDLYALEDDREVFPNYFAVILYRADLEERAPHLVAAFRRLEGALDEETMTRFNALVQVEGLTETGSAQRLLAEVLGVDVEIAVTTRAGRIWRYTREHLALVAVAMLFGAAIAIPLGIAAAKERTVGRAVIPGVEIIQTVPSLALLVFMIPLLGIGFAPAAAALFLYSLLPMVRNTHAGLTQVPRSLDESAEALGLSPAAKLWKVELPLAMPAILAGIKTSTVITIGFATLGAFIGAGGYGSPILTGLRRDHYPTILEGAIPAALMAILAGLLLAGLSRIAISPGLRR